MSAIKNKQKTLEETKATGKKNEKANFIKRCIVAIWILSWYLIPIIIGPVSWILNQNLNAALIYNEFLNISWNKKKDTNITPLIEWEIYFTVLFWLSTNTIFTKVIFETSGFNDLDYPGLFFILKNRIHFVLLLSIQIFILFVYGLEKSKLKYQY